MQRIERGGSEEPAMVRGAVLLLTWLAWGLALTLLAGCSDDPTSTRVTCTDQPTGSAVASTCEED
jgi:hypothetical protein